MSALGSIADQWTTIFEQTSSLGVAGAVAGVAVGDEQLSMAHGIANLNTGQPFTEDTGFLLGSVTKVLTTTVLMRLVERGEVDLDASARRYVPDAIAKWSTHSLPRPGPGTWRGWSQCSIPMSCCRQNSVRGR
jgi:CubicO group peptidase (beta-lactamase class C family)